MIVFDSVTVNASYDFDDDDFGDGVAGFDYGNGYGVGGDGFDDGDGYGDGVGGGGLGDGTGGDYSSGNGPISFEVRS